MQHYSTASWNPLFTMACFTYDHLATALNKAQCRGAAMGVVTLWRNFAPIKTKNDREQVRIQSIRNSFSLPVSVVHTTVYAFSDLVT